MMNKHLQYAGMALDRCDALRRDADAVQQLWDSEHTFIVPVWQGKKLFRIASESEQAIQEAPIALWCRRSELDAALNALIERADHPVFLGQQGTDSYFAVDIAEADGNALSVALQAEFIDLRRVGPMLPAETAALLAYARGMLLWRQQHRFCSRCGHGTTASHGGHVLICSNVACQRETYPRTDPAVIMLVERTGPGGVKQCLLGCNANWVKGSFSTLAGFVEPGESLEEAVRREVAEETGVVVGKVNYIISQPWPFPSSIMLGFVAEALETEITIDPHEIAEAYWFSREELAGFGAWGDETSERNLPRKDSIARFLIDHWLDGHG